MIKFENVNELQAYYRKFSGKKMLELYEYVVTEFPEIKLSTNKGVVGQILEGLVGNAPNSNPEPDIANLKLDLKVLALRKQSNEILPKERSKIKSINYNEIVNQSWNNSDARKKMEYILFLLYEHPTGVCYKEWKHLIFKGTLLYELVEENENQVKEDWEGIKYKVSINKANELSEKNSKILGASTSGSGKPVTYGAGYKAKPRSYSLKHSYLKYFYKKSKPKIVYQKINNDDLSFEEYFLKELTEKLSNKKLLTLTQKYNVKYSNNSKSAFYNLIRKIFDIDEKSKIKEIDEYGICIKTIPVSSCGKVWESMSFPKFSLVDLIEEEWETDDIENNEAVFKLTISQKFLFIPVVKDKEIKVKDGKNKQKFVNWKSWKIGKPFYWEASDAEIKGIKDEWEIAKSIVEKGVKTQKVKHGKGYRQENNLLKSTETKYIHIRPHTNNASNIDLPYKNYTNDEVKICWQSFWLNKSFIEKLIKKQ